MTMTRFEVYMHLIDRKRLARLMVIQGVSGRALALAAGWKSHSYLQRLLRGEENTLAPEPAVKIATYLGVDVADLFVPRVSSGGGQAVRQQRAS
jgi:transcriptional regulator with XRE-family HTH domain